MPMALVAAASSFPGDLDRCGWWCGGCFGFGLWEWAEGLGALVGDQEVVVVGGAPEEYAGVGLFDMPDAGGFGAVLGAGEWAEVPEPGLSGRVRWCGCAASCGRGRGGGRFGC